VTFDRTYGGSGSSPDEGYSVQQTSDGGYIIAGTTESFGPYFLIYLIRTDALGDTLWTKAISGGEEGRCVRQTTDGGYIVAGHTSENWGDACLVKTDSLGDVIWTGMYGLWTEYQDANCVEQTFDGGYIFVGSTIEWSYNYHDLYLVKTDSSGIQQWYRTYGDPQEQEFGRCVRQTSDGGYILTGSNAPFEGSGHIHLVKTDSLGNVQWKRDYGVGSGWSILEAAEGGNMVAGYARDPANGDFYLMKVNSAGDSIWANTYGDPAVREIGHSSQETKDGGFVIAGTADDDIYLVKTDSFGSLLWARTYDRSELDEGWSVLQTSDGGYAIAGFTGSSGAHDQDVYLIKTDALGRVLKPKADRQRWTILGYMNGENVSHEGGDDAYVFKSVNQMETAVDPSKYDLVIQWDRGDGAEWEECRRYRITRDTDPNEVNSDLLERMGERDVGDPDELARFLTWGVATFPADHYCVFVVGHGTGLNKELGFSHDKYPMANNVGIAEGEWREVLKKATAALGGNKIDVWCFGACLMGMIEVEYEAKDYIKFLVHSEHYVPRDSYPFDDILSWLNAFPNGDPRVLAAVVAKRYKWYHFWSSLSVTHSAVVLDNSFDRLASAVHLFARELIKAGGKANPIVADCRDRTQEYYILEEDYPEHIDLYHFAELIIGELLLPATLREAAIGVMSAVGYPPPIDGRPLIYEGHLNHGGDIWVINSHGIAIYYPKNTASGIYGRLRFAEENDWDDFIQGKPLSPDDQLARPLGHEAGGAMHPRDGSQTKVTQTRDLATELSQNTPNPFANRAKISYALSARGHTVLDVYDACGQLVRTLVDEEQAAGHHLIEWDGRDSAGNPVPTGIYFYRLRAGDFTDMKKMVVVR
jgi:hypothetical protein